MLWNKQEPKTIVMRKSIIIVFAVFVLLIIGAIVGFLLHSQKSTNDQPSKQTSTVHKYATQSEMHWINETVVPSTAEQSKSTALPQTQQNQSATTANTSITNTQPTAMPTSTLSADDAKAMSAAINTNQITGDAPTTISNNAQNTSSTAPAANNQTTPTGSNDDQNMQGEKKAFLDVNSNPNPDDYLSSTIQNPVSNYEIQAGTIVPGILLTGINSDLPGQITAQVRSNVYDSISGKYLLIPQGAKLTGLYDSQVAYGQNRVLIVWNRIIYPNGQSIDLQGMPGIDLSGYAGFHDQVNNHYLKMFGSVVLMSVMSAGAQLSQPQQQSVYPYASSQTVGQTLAQSLGTNIANTGTMIAQKDLNVQPTLIIRPGYEFNISVTKDMIFPSAYGAS